VSRAAILAASADEVVSGIMGRREFVKRASVLGVSAASVSTLLSACGDATTTHINGQRLRPPAEARQGGTLVVGPYGDEGNYDPATNAFDYPAMPLGSIYEGLTVYPAQATSWTPHNLLAESLEKSGDSTRFRFKLREGVQFHRGFGEMTAADVKYSFERAASRVPLYPGAPKSAVSYYAADLSGLEAIKLTGRYSGEIRFKRPFVPFETITLPFATSGYITSQKAVDKYGVSFPQNPIGTGPYEVASYSPNTEMVLQKFSEYSGANRAVGARNAFDEIRIAMTPLNARTTGEALTIPLQSGEVDFTDSLGALDVETIATNKGFTGYTPLESLGYFFLAIDVKHPRLRDLRVRQAIRYALDVGEINLANRMPLSATLRMIIAPDLPVGYWADAPEHQRDVAKAKALLTAAGAEDLSLLIATPGIATTPGDPNAVMQVIQSNLKDVGISVQIIETPADSYTDTPGAGELAWSWFGGAPDPYYQLEWFTCDQLGVWNYASWCNPKYSALEKRLGTVTDPAQRGTIAVRMQRLMHESAAYIFFSQIADYCASRSNIQAVFDRAGNPSLHYFYRV